MHHISSQRISKDSASVVVSFVNCSQNSKVFSTKRSELQPKWELSNNRCQQKINCPKIVWKQWGGICTKHLSCCLTGNFPVASSELWEIKFRTLVKDIREDHVCCARFAKLPPIRLCSVRITLYSMSWCMYFSREHQPILIYSHFPIDYLPLAFTVHQPATINWAITWTMSIGGRSSWDGQVHFANESFANVLIRQWKCFQCCCTMMHHPIE